MHLGDRIVQLKEELSCYRGFLVISPGNWQSTNRGVAYFRKHYNHWGRVIDLLTKVNVPVVVNLAARDTEVFHGLTQVAPTYTGDLLGLQVLIGGSRGLLTVDSGPAHLATLANVPVVTILTRLQPPWPEGLGRLATPLSNASVGLVGEVLDDISPELIVTTVRTTCQL